MRKFHIIILLFVISCSSKNTEQTKRFKQYLTSVHQEEIEDKIYILMPLNICGSCVKNMTNLLNTSIENTNKLVIILGDYTSVTIKNKAKELSHFKVLYDNKMQMVKQSIIVGDKIVLLKVKNKQIQQSISYLPHENEQKILKFTNNP